MPAVTRTVQQPPRDHRADLALVRDALAGDPEAVDRFVHRMRCVPLVLYAKNRELGNALGPEELADLAQDVLAVVWRKLETYSGRAALETWTYRFCVLEMMNTLRRRDRRRHGDEVLQRDADASPEPPSQPAEYDHVYLGLERLGPPESSVVRLKHFEELTFDEIGRALSIPANTAKTYYYRGLERLRHILRPHLQEEPA